MNNLYVMNLNLLGTTLSIPATREELTCPLTGIETKDFLYNHIMSFVTDRCNDSAGVEALLKEGKPYLCPILLEHTNVLKQIAPTSMNNDILPFKLADGIISVDTTHSFFNLGPGQRTTLNKTLTNPLTSDTSITLFQASTMHTPTNITVKASLEDLRKATLTSTYFRLMVDTLHLLCKIHGVYRQRVASIDTPPSPFPKTVTIKISERETPTYTYIDEDQQPTLSLNYILKGVEDYSRSAEECITPELFLGPPTPDQAASQKEDKLSRVLNYLLAGGASKAEYINRGPNSAILKLPEGLDNLAAPTEKVIVADGREIHLVLEEVETPIEEVTASIEEYVGKVRTTSYNDQAPTDK